MRDLRAALARTTPYPWSFRPPTALVNRPDLLVVRARAEMVGSMVGAHASAKVSARGKQRSLGVFDSPEDAALEVLRFYIDWALREPPASPTKPRNKRGEGRRPDSRHGMRKGSVRRQVARESPVTR